MTASPTPLPPTDECFRQDAYRRECTSMVLAVTPQGVVLDRTVFYPLGGGQAGDRGVLIAADGRQWAIADTRKYKDADGKPTGAIAHVPADPQAPGPAVGETVTTRIDWAHRHRLMRFHTTTHLLCHLVPQPVDGCSITARQARLDFHMTEPLDAQVLNDGLARLVAADLPVTVGQVTDAELDAQPQLVRSMSVQPPRGSGRIRTIRIGADALIDLQPCGGTHVARTGEIGDVRVVKIEKKSATTRRVVLQWGDADTWPAGT